MIANDDRARVAMFIAKQAIDPRRAVDMETLNAMVALLDRLDHLEAALRGIGGLAVRHNKKRKSMCMCAGCCAVATAIAALGGGA